MFCSDHGPDDDVIPSNNILWCGYALTAYLALFGSLGDIVFSYSINKYNNATLNDECPQIKYVFIASCSIELLVPFIICSLIYLYKHNFDKWICVVLLQTAGQFFALMPAFLGQYALDEICYNYISSAAMRIYVACHCVYASLCVIYLFASYLEFRGMCYGCKFIKHSRLIIDNNHDYM